MSNYKNTKSMRFITANNKVKTENTPVCVCYTVPKIISVSAYRKWAYHDWSRCIGVYLVSGPDIYKYEKNPDIYCCVCSSRGRPVFFMEKIRLFFGQCILAICILCPCASVHCANINSMLHHGFLNNFNSTAVSLISIFWTLWCVFVRVCVMKHKW